MSAKSLFWLGLSLMFIAVIAATALGSVMYFGANYIDMPAQSNTAAFVSEVIVPALLPLGAGLFCGSFIVAARQYPHYRASDPVGVSGSAVPHARSARTLGIWGMALIVLAVVAHFAVDPLMSAYAEYIGVSADSPGNLQFGVASTLTGILNMILLPLGVGFVSSALVVAALFDSRREDPDRAMHESPDANKP